MNIHSVALTAVSRKTRSVPTDPAPASKRDAILRAAIDVFASKGYFNAQVADVARAAGVAAGTVYLYFKGKDDLLVSIFERSMREGLTKGRAAVAPGARPPRPPRPRQKPRDRVPGRAAAVDEVHGTLFRNPAARLSRPHS